MGGFHQGPTRRSVPISDASRSHVNLSCISQPFSRSSSALSTSAKSDNLMVTACVDLLQERKADPRCCFTLWVCGLFRLHGKGACSDLVSAVKPCSCAICCGPTSPVGGCPAAPCWCWGNGFTPSEHTWRGRQRCWPASPAGRWPCRSSCQQAQAGPASTIVKWGMLTPHRLPILALAKQMPQYVISGSAVD